VALDVPVGDYNDTESLSFKSIVASSKCVFLVFLPFFLCYYPLV